MEIIGRLTLVQNKYAVTNKCINFKSKEQEDELISQFPHRNFDSNIFMQDGDTILVPLNYEECIKYNYCYFNNRINDLEKKRYFCYITNYEYVEPNVTRIGIAVDTLQTFLFDIDKFRGNMERCHSARRINVGTTEEPRYIINPDLYFMEDDVDVYKPVVTEKAPNPHQTYIVLTFAIGSTYKIDNFDYVEEEGLVSQSGVYVDKEVEVPTTSINSNLKHTGLVTGRITFPISSSYSKEVEFFKDDVQQKIERYNSSTKDIGDTSLYTIVLKTSPTHARDIDYLPLELFQELFPLLQDKIVDSFYIDNVDETFKRVSGITLTFNAVAPNVSTLSYYAVPYTRLQALKKMVTLNNSNDLHPDKWSNRIEDTSILRNMKQEKKLELYPYSFVKVSSLGSELIWKYQEYYKVLENHSSTCYSFIKTFNVLSPNNKVMSTFLYDKENLIKYDEETFNTIEIAGSNTICNYYLNMKQGELLPSLSIYQSKYTEYLNYQKAIVDANNILGTIGDVGNIAMSVATSGLGGTIAGASGRLSASLTPKGHKGAKWKKEYTKINNEISRGVGEVGGTAFDSSLNIVNRYINTSLNEQKLKKQPMNMLHQGTTSDKLFTSLFETTGEIYDYILTKYDVIDNIKSIYEQKFYNYGYAIPVDVELTRAEFFDIINNRQYFCYMEWNSLEVESEIPTIYMDDIVARLTSGVRFENTSNDRLFQAYTINLNNKETSIPAKPFFVRNY